MIFIDTFIETLQFAKTNFLNTYVPDSRVRIPLQNFVDAQTAFAKTMTKTVDDYITSEVVKSVPGSSFKM
jgi:hypothetical protein